MVRQVRNTLFHLLALTDVAQEYGEDLLSIFHRLRDTGLGEELTAVLAPPENIRPPVHVPGGLRLRAELTNMPAMGLDEALRQQSVQRLPQHLCCRVTENSFRALVEDENALILVYADDGIRRHVDDVGEARFAVAQQGIRITRCLLRIDQFAHQRPHQKIQQQHANQHQRRQQRHDELQLLGHRVIQLRLVDLDHQAEPKQAHGRIGRDHRLPPVILGKENAGFAIQGIVRRQRLTLDDPGKTLELFSGKIAQKTVHLLFVVCPWRAHGEFAGFPDRRYIGKGAAHQRQADLRHDRADAVPLFIKDIPAGMQNELPIPQQECAVFGVQGNAQIMLLGKMSGTRHFMTTRVVNGQTCEAGQQK